jgi:hypothetical protein
VHSANFDNDLPVVLLSHRPRQARGESCASVNRDLAEDDSSPDNLSSCGHAYLAANQD